MDTTNKKHLVLCDLYKHCKAKGNFIFHNDLVKESSKKHKFGNPFDVTKLDSTDKLPDFFKENDICLLHLGGGNHKFIKGIDKLYHAFEPMQENIIWEYQKGLLDEHNDSESNILSMANNYNILHHFLFFDEHSLNHIKSKNIERYIKNYNNAIDKARIHNICIVISGDDECHLEYSLMCMSARTYFSHRTNSDFSYYFNGEQIIATNQQIEIDLTLEFNGTVGIFEAKNGEPKDFNIYQIYHPFLYYHNSKLPIRHIHCCYLVRNNNIIKLWDYTFNDPSRIDSIKFVKSRQYTLEPHKYIPRAN